MHQVPTNIAIAICRWNTTVFFFVCFVRHSSTPSPSNRLVCTCLYILYRCTQFSRSICPYRATPLPMDRQLSGAVRTPFDGGQKKKNDKTTTATMWQDEKKRPAWGHIMAENKNIQKRNKKNLWVRLCADNEAAVYTRRQFVTFWHAHFPVHRYRVHCARIIIKTVLHIITHHNVWGGYVQSS